MHVPDRKRRHLICCSALPWVRSAGMATRDLLPNMAPYLRSIGIVAHGAIGATLTNPGFRRCCSVPFVDTTKRKGSSFLSRHSVRTATLLYSTLQRCALVSYYCNLACNYIITAKTIILPLKLHLRRTPFPNLHTWTRSNEAAYEASARHA